MNQLSDVNLHISVFCVRVGFADVFSRTAPCFRGPHCSWRSRWFYRCFGSNLAFALVLHMFSVFFWKDGSMFERAKLQFAFALVL